MDFYQTWYVHLYCKDLVVWIANGQIPSFFFFFFFFFFFVVGGGGGRGMVVARDTPIFSFPDDNLSKC